MMNTFEKYEIPPIDRIKEGDVKDILLNQKIVVNQQGDSFPLKLYDIFKDSGLIFKTSKDLAQWEDNSIIYMYQNQLNFAVWCATSGCGVSFQDHLLHKAIRSKFL